MSLHTSLRRGALAVPLALAIVAAPWLLPGAGTAPIGVLPEVAALPCDLAQAVSGDHARSLQLPGDLPLHLRLRISCSTRS